MCSLIIQKTLFLKFDILKDNLSVETSSLISWTKFFVKHHWKFSILLTIFKQNFITISIIKNKTFNSVLNQFFIVAIKFKHNAFNIDFSLIITHFTSKVYLMIYDYML